MTKKEKLLTDSGLKTDDGRDVITEITATEFKQYISQYGINIGIVSSVVLDGYNLSTNDYAKHRQYLRRVGYVAFVELNTNNRITRDKKRWRKFVESLEEYL